MKLYRTTKVADAVLAIIDNMLNEDEEGTLYVEPYQNGREHGWSISKSGSSGKQAVFSENRNSDQIVVYTGTTVDFAMAGNLPNDKVYRKAKYFSYNEQYKSAEFIVEYLK